MAKLGRQERMDDREQEDKCRREVERFRGHTSLQNVDHSALYVAVAFQRHRQSWSEIGRRSQWQGAHGAKTNERERQAALCFAQSHATSEAAHTCVASHVLSTQNDFAKVALGGVSPVAYFFLEKGE